MKIINKIYKLLDKKDRTFLLIILFFSIFVSFLETLGIGIIMPFINVAMDFELVEKNAILHNIYAFFKFDDPKSFIIAFGVFLVFFYLLRSFFNIFYYYLLAKYTQGRYYVYANKLFKKYLTLEYKNFITKNPSIMTKSIITEAQNLSLFLSNALFMLSEIIVSIFIYSFLLFVNWKITLIVSIFLFLNIVIILKVVSPKIKEAGKERDVYQGSFYKLLSTVFGNYKVLKLKQNIDEVFFKFQDATNGYAKVNIIHSVYSQVPRLYLEAVAFSLISVLVVILIVIENSSYVENTLNLITVFLLGLFRLMPSINRIVSSYNNMLFYLKAIDILLEDLNLKSEKIGLDNIEFKDSIELKNISFAFNEENILQNISLSIKKNEKIAFVGESGSGKTTLVDNIIGIYTPTSGKIVIDDKELNQKNLTTWREKIGYIPQSVSVFEGTIAENISLEENFDKEKVKSVLRQVKLWDHFDKQQGVDTLISENSLSGGQKQRVSIARALYKDPEILVLDEATSALDEKIEREIMNEIYSIVKDKTLIIITHRLSTIFDCERVYEMKNGNIEQSK